MPANLQFITPEKYLATERKAEFKSEYIDGVIYVMAGGGPDHSLITGNLVTELNIQLRDKPCLVFTSDMKIGVPDSRQFFYPDVSVVCNKPKYIDDEKDVLLNPILLFEVLSDSTAAYDRGKKFRSYQEIESFREYLLVAQNEPVVERFVKQSDNNWLYTKVEGLDQSIELVTVNCLIALKAIYAKVL